MAKKLVCTRCDSGTGKHSPTEPQPSMRTLSRWSDDGVAESTDGCQVEPDGKCEHGHSSWLLRLGFI